MEPRLPVRSALRQYSSADCIFHRVHAGNATGKTYSKAEQYLSVRMSVPLSKKPWFPISSDEDCFVFLLAYRCVARCSVCCEVSWCLDLALSSSSSPKAGYDTVKSWPSRRRRVLQCHGVGTYADTYIQRCGERDHSACWYDLFTCSCRHVGACSQSNYDP